MLFNRHVRFLERLLPLPGAEELRRTPQFYRADPELVRRSGNALLLRFLDAAPLPRATRYVCVDTKVHMLMPGFHACIPGWHCDDFHRPGGAAPDLEGIERAWSDHVLLVVGDTALPELAKGPLRLPPPSELATAGRPLYGVYHELIEELRPERVAPASGQMVGFSCLDFHRGTPATRRGWRLFARITASDHREPRNEVRTQTQVYLTQPFEQW